MANPTRSDVEASAPEEFDAVQSHPAARLKTLGIGERLGKLGSAMNEDVPSTMSVIEISAPGGPEVLRLTQRPTPKPGPNEVLIRVIAAGVNRPDVMQRLGH